MKNTVVFKVLESKAPTLSLPKPSKKTNWEGDSPTFAQCRDIARKCTILGIKEPLEEKVYNKMEARNLQYRLRMEVKIANAKRKRKK